MTRFAELLSGEHVDAATAEEMGNRMFESHGSYSMCGLGSDGTDWIVDRIAGSGLASGFYGAKITGGGSGGTVAILGTEAAGPAVRALAREYERETGRSAFVFEGSGPGAEESGVLSFRAP